MVITILLRLDFFHPIYLPLFCILLQQMFLKAFTDFSLSHTHAFSLLLFNPFLIIFFLFSSFLIKSKQQFRTALSMVCLSATLPSRIELCLVFFSFLLLTMITSDLWLWSLPSQTVRPSVCPRSTRINSLSFYVVSSGSAEGLIESSPSIQGRVPMVRRRKRKRRRRQVGVDYVDVNVDRPV